ASDSGFALLTVHEVAPRSRSSKPIWPLPRTAGDPLVRHSAFCALTLRPGGHYVSRSAFHSPAEVVRSRGHRARIRRTARAPPCVRARVLQRSGAGRDRRTRTGVVAAAVAPA